MYLLAKSSSAPALRCRPPLTARPEASATPRSSLDRTSESAEQLLEIPDDLFFNLKERNFDASQFAREARHPMPLNAAGRDLVEP